MAINSRSLSAVQGDVTSAATTEGDFRSGMNDALTQVDANQIKLALASNADLTKLNSITATASEINVLTGANLASTDIDAAQRLSGAGNGASGRYLQFVNSNAYTWATLPTQGFNLIDGDGTPTSFSINNGNYLRFVEGDTNQTGAININFTSGTGTQASPYLVAFDVKDNSIGAAELNVSGNGTNGQFLRSDGDGSFTWVSQTSASDSTITLSGDVTASSTFTLNQSNNETINLTLNNNVVDAAALNVSGNGTNGQFLRSDGDGSFTWNTNVSANNPTITVTQPTRSNQTFSLNQSGGTTIALNDTTYTAGNGLTLTGTEFTMSGTYTGTFQATGAITSSSGDVTAFSDGRLKENIEVIPDALDKVSQVRGVTYDRNDIEAPRQTGVIAQELKEVLPEAVRETEDGILTVSYGNIVGLLIESIKELKTRVEELENGTTN